MRALAAGDLRGWHGLPAGLTREDAERELGAADPPRDLGGRFAGEPRVLRHHAPTQAAPNGVDVWFGSQGAVAIEYGPASLPAPPEDQLGPPEATVGDALVYAGRGLVVYVRRDGVVERVIGFEPCSTEEFLAGPLSPS